MNFAYTLYLPGIVNAGADTSKEIPSESKNCLEKRKYFSKKLFLLFD